MTRQHPSSRLLTVRFASRSHLATPEQLMLEVYDIKKEGRTAEESAPIA
jgi:hypothetical protein